MDYSTYPRHQREVLEAGLPFDSLSSKMQTNIYKTAISKGDQELAAKMEPYILKRQEEYRERHNKQSREYYHKIAAPRKRKDLSGGLNIMPAAVKNDRYTVT